MIAGDWFSGFGLFDVVFACEWWLEWIVIVWIFGWWLIWPSGFGFWVFGWCVCLGGLLFVVFLVRCFGLGDFSGWLSLGLVWYMVDCGWLCSVVLGICLWFAVQVGLPSLGWLVGGFRLVVCL